MSQPVARSRSLSRRLHERSMTPRFSWVVSLLILLSGIFFTETLARYYQAEIASERHARTLAFASELRARSDRELNSVLYLASGIVGYLVVRHQEIDPNEIDRILSVIHTYGRHIRNFTISVGSKISYIYPLKGNESMLGRDYSEIQEQWPAIRKALEKKEILLTGRVELVQGGAALIYREPVLVDGKLWGLLSTVIDLASFQKAVFSEAQSDRFEFAIRTENRGSSADSAAQDGGPLYGNQNLFADPTAVILVANMPNDKWIYAVRSKDRPHSFTYWAIRCAGWLLSALLAFGIFVVLRQRITLARLAGFDSLTDLPNRRLFDDRLEQAICRQSRRNTQVAVVFIDVNDFKPINDRYGHRVGDRVLHTLAVRICAEVRGGDTVARWAGDEFAIIVEDAEITQTDHLVRRLHQQIEAPMDIEGIPLRVSASVGVAFYPSEAENSADLLELADQRMYKNKDGKATPGSET